jgi:hypothetical protein
VFQGLFKVVKPLGEYLGGGFIRSLELASAAKAARIISGGLKLGLPMQLKVLIHSPMQLKMVQQL